MRVYNAHAHSGPDSSASCRGLLVAIGLDGQREDQKVASGASARGKLHGAVSLPDVEVAGVGVCVRDTLRDRSVAIGQVRVLAEELFCSPMDRTCGLCVVKKRSALGAVRRFGYETTRCLNVKVRGTIRTGHLGWRCGC